MGDPSRRATTVVVHEDGEIWLEDDGERVVLEIGEPFDVGGHAFVVQRRPDDRRRSDDYVLRVSDSGGAPVASVTDPVRGVTHIVGSPHRALLLCALARRRAEDLSARRTPELAGWCDDDHVLGAVWGRMTPRIAPSSYSVLVHRVRRELAGAGFDPRFIEKRRGAIRVSLDRLVIDDHQNR
jgi:hypothetical protein